MVAGTYLERINHEDVFTLVRPGQGVVLGVGNTTRLDCSLGMTRASDVSFLAIAFRLDCFIDDHEGGRLPSFRELLTHARVEYHAGVKRQREMTFRSGLPAIRETRKRGKANSSPSVMTISTVTPIEYGSPDLLLHAAPDGDFVPVRIPARQNTSIALLYEGTPIPIGFLRIVVLGLEVRDVS